MNKQVPPNSVQRFPRSFPNGLKEALCRFLRTKCDLSIELAKDSGSLRYTFTIPVPKLLHEDVRHYLFVERGNDWKHELDKTYKDLKSGKKLVHQYISDFLLNAYDRGTRKLLEAENRPRTIKRRGRIRRRETDRRPTITLRSGAVRTFQPPPDALWVFLTDKDLRARIVQARNEHKLRDSNDKSKAGDPESIKLSIHEIEPSVEPAEVLQLIRQRHGNDTPYGLFVNSNLDIVREAFIRCLARVEGISSQLTRHKFSTLIRHGELLHKALTSKFRLVQLPDGRPHRIPAHSSVLTRK